MADCLNNESQVTSNLDSVNQDSLTSSLDTVNAITSDVGANDVMVSNAGSDGAIQSSLDEAIPLESPLDLPYARTYSGAETDNIIVSVDNNAYTISATVKQIKFKTLADFPSVGSDRLIYIDATSNTLYSWDSDAQAYTKLVADVTIPTKLSEFENDGDGDSPFATEDYVSQNGGKIDSISVNGVPQEIDENKNVNIEISGTGGGTKIIWEVWE